MRKRFKMLAKSGKLYILRWTVESKVFDPDWDAIADFVENEFNRERCKKIVKLMNECDTKI